MSDTPFVSVIVPVYNAAATVHLCLQALVALDYPADRHEVIVVDNGSSDRTREILAHYPLVVLAEPGRGSYRARNRGAAAAQGTILAFTDADCVAERTWLRALVSGFTEPGIGCVAGEVLSPLSRNAVEEFARRRDLLGQRQTLGHPYRPYPITANCAYRMDVFRRLGGFRPEMQSGGDADLAWRMQTDLQLRVAFSPDAIVVHYHRSTLGGLYAQSRKYAIGAMDLARYHRLPQPPLLRCSARLVRAAARSAVAVPWRWIRHGGSFRAAEVMEPICDVVWRAGEVAGLFAGRRSLGR